MSVYFIKDCPKHKKSLKEESKKQEEASFCESKEKICEKYEPGFALFSINTELDTSRGVEIGAKTFATSHYGMENLITLGNSLF